MAALLQCRAPMGGRPRIPPPNPSIWSAEVQLSRLGGHFQSRRLVLWGKGRGPHPCFIQEDESPEKEEVFPSKKNGLQVNDSNNYSKLVNFCYYQSMT